MLLGLVLYVFLSFAVIGVQLVVYEVAVRYTWVGAILNGRKSRVVSPPLPGGED